MAGLSPGEDLKLPIFQVDAFARRRFAGNPAAVVVLFDWLPDETLQAIAMENNLPETAFIVPRDEIFDLTQPSQPNLESLFIGEG